MRAQALEDIMYEYELIRQKQIKKRQKRLESAYSKLPELKEIDQELTKAGAAAATAIINDPNNGLFTAKKLKQHINSLLKLRSKLLKQGGFSEKYTDIEYQCYQCKDTGYIGGKKCNCLEQRLIFEAQKNSNLSKLFETQDFNTFNFSYYSKEIDDKEGVSPYERIKDIFNTCKSYANNFNNEIKNLFFYGDVGLGKTFLSSAIAKVVLLKGNTVLYQSATKLFSLYSDFMFSRIDQNEAKSRIQQFFDADLLIIDDLGTEAINTYSISFLFELLNDRILNEKKTIISTNLTISELPKIYTSRLHSRILEHYILLKFIGKDIRRIKMLEK